MRAEQRRRRRRAGDQRRERVLERPGVRVVDERRVHGRCAVVVGHALLAEQPPDHLRVDRAQAHVLPAAAVTAHGKHQPLQWNIGSVQR